MSRAKKKTAAGEPEIARLAFNPPGSARQIRFYQLLVAARKQWFMDALSDALGQLDQDTVKRQIREYVPDEAQKILAAAGLRDEHVFPVPAVLEAKPSLVGYYRLLLGAPQKSFYKGSTGMGRFKSMEELGAISEKTRPWVPIFCQVMAKPLAELLRGIPKITERDLRELPLLTFGSQLQGSNNTQIGKIAMKDVFVALKEIVAKYVVSTTESKLTLKNSAGRTVLITLAHDPDVRIQEQVSNQVHHKVAIEVKGGSDVSNVHNRAGEAEKSHQKAKKSGFPEFWTIISKRGLDLSKLQSESPTTNRWFDVAEVLARNGPDWDDLRQRLAGACGIPLADSKIRRPDAEANGSRPT
ncbi:MAG: XcyI family restriction endonuclease [Candidatus Sulfotelmatobacter sp.]